MLWECGKDKPAMGDSFIQLSIVDHAFDVMVVCT